MNTTKATAAAARWITGRILGTTPRQGDKENSWARLHLPDAANENSRRELALTTAAYSWCRARAWKALTFTCWIQALLRNLRSYYDADLDLWMCQRSLPAIAPSVGALYRERWKVDQGTN
jgi:hypothetical protein